MIESQVMTINNHVPVTGRTAFNRIRRKSWWILVIYNSLQEEYMIFTSLLASVMSCSP